MKILGEARLGYPPRHIEIDNRLAWFLGRLDQRYGRDAFYVHLRRDRAETALSYSRRAWLGYLVFAYARGIYVGMADELDWVDVAEDMCETIDSNIRLFLRDKPRQMSFSLSNAKSDFKEFWERIGATGNFELASAEWDISHNAGNSGT